MTRAGGDESCMCSASWSASGGTINLDFVTTFLLRFTKFKLIVIESV